MKGKLIVLEAGDASGKATQTNILYHRLLENKYPVRKIEFPNYKSPSSSLIKMYLNGDFGKDPEQVSPYVASTFYTADRYASFKTEWEPFYEQGGILIADRYTSSNMVHQASKIRDPKDRNEYLLWLWNFEFEVFRLPKPDLVLFLDMPPKHSIRLLAERVSQNREDQDIHEQNKAYLKRCYDSALELAHMYNWHKVSCTYNDKVKSIEEIHEEIYKIVIGVLNVN